MPPANAENSKPAMVAPTVQPDAKLSAAEKSAWQSSMTEVKRLIGQHQFAEAEKRLTAALGTAKLPVQVTQIEHLNQALTFVRDIRQEIVNAIAGLGAAENLKIGTSTIASFVEGNAERIVVKVSGERREYRLEEMPVAMALALADLKLDPQHATSLARKGAFILVHPKNNTTLERGKQMLQEAATAGAISMELAKFYEDDYGLAQWGN